MRSRFPTTDPITWPRVQARARAELGLSRWSEAAAQNDDPTVADFARRYAASPDGRAILERIFANSPFLSDNLLLEAQFFKGIIELGLGHCLSTTIADLRQELFREDDRSRLMEHLRRAKRRVALATGLADAFGEW